MSHTNRANGPLELARREVRELYDAHGLERYHRRSDLTVAVARWKRRNGVAQYNKTMPSRNGARVSYEDLDGHHAIGVNERIYEQGNIVGFIDTVRHELAHVMAYVDPGCGVRDSSPGHGAGWKQWATKLGADTSSRHNRKTNEYNYWYACPNGCWRTKKIRKSKKIKHPEKYTCKRCGATCESGEL